MPVSTIHPLYAEMQPIWSKVRRACAGDKAVKDSTVLDLPAVFAKDEPERYRQYLERAYFLNITGRTREALQGMVFRRGPTKDIPSPLDEYTESIDGAGQSLEQLSKALIGDLLETGRYGLLVDYPQAPEGLNRQSERMLRLRPTVASYPAESIINWRFDAINERKMLTLVVLIEERETDDDEFSHETETVYRVLRLRDGVYTQALYNESGDALTEEYSPRMAGGATFDHIPFHFAGAVNNYPEPDMPTLYDLAVVNIAHYRNTADLEESSFVAGQPTYHLDIGETDEAEWKILNPNGLKVGSRNGVLSKKGKLELVQADANSLPLELMRQKEMQMVGIGARIVQPGGQAQTAEATRLEASAESSTLDNLVGNASEALEAALEDMALFAGANPEQVFYSLNREYWAESLTAQDLQAIQAGVGRIYSPLDAIQMIRSGKIGFSPERTDDEILLGAAESMLDDRDPFAGGVA